MAIRSGRFKVDVASTIILGRSGAPYRIFNSGDAAFTVDAGDGNAVALPIACSRDVVVDGSVTIAPVGAVTVEGIYDYLGPPDSVRSGRFKGDASGTAGIPIIQSRYGTIYRIFNSGDNPFDVHGGGKSTTPLKPTFSLDVVLNDNVVIKTTAAGEVEGIYDCLDVQSTIRSGRFKLKTAPAAGDPKHKIIDFTKAGQKPEAYYRVFNSGGESFQVWEGNPTSPSSNQLGAVASGQSLDFEIGDGPRRDIYVDATAWPIDGIYEFLGLED